MTAAGRPIRGGCGSSWRRRASRCRSSRSISATLAHKSAAYTAINPLQRVPALVLDDGTVITESIAICRYFEALHPEPPLFGAAPRRWRWSRCGTGGSNSICSLPVSHVFRNIASGHEGDGGAAGAGLGRGEQAARRWISSACSTASLQDRPFVAGDRYHGRRHHRPGRGRFHEAGQARGAGDCANLKRWHAEVSARPSASGLTCG